MKYPEDPPFRISGGATVWHLNSLYLIGGYTVEYDCELKCFYQSPSSNVWIFDPSLGTWRQGPPLPKESFVAKNKTIKFRGYCLGGLLESQLATVYCILFPLWVFRENILGGFIYGVWGKKGFLVFEKIFFKEYTQ